MRGLNSICFAAVLSALTLGLAAASQAGQYLVVSTAGPALPSPKDALARLEKTVIPTFEMLETLKTEKTITAMGVALGSRRFVLVLEAPSLNDADATIRDLPIWPLLNWTVTPLQTIKARAARERRAVEELKKMVR